jgi:hypothetical protein
MRWSDIMNVLKRPARTGRPIIGLALAALALAGCAGTTGATGPGATIGAVGGTLIAMDGASRLCPNWSQVVCGLVGAAVGGAVGHTAEQLLVQPFGGQTAAQAQRQVPVQPVYASPMSNRPAPSYPPAGQTQQGAYHQIPTANGYRLVNAQNPRDVWHYPAVPGVMGPGCVIQDDYGNWLSRGDQSQCLYVGGPYG